MSRDDFSGMPAWLIAAFDQEDAAVVDWRRKNRSEFEATLRRNARSETEVQQGLAWFDAFRSRLDDARDIHAAGTAPPEPERVPVPSLDDAYDDGEQRRADTTRVHHTRFEYELPPEPPAPGKATRIAQSPAVYLKALTIGAVIGSLVWTGITGLLVWLFGTAWWGWWPSLLTVPLASIALLAWLATAQNEIRHWITYGGREPLRSRPRFK